MLRYITLLVICTGLVRAQEPALLPARNHPGAPKRLLWKVSLGALVAAQIMDTNSSWGYRELNPILRSPSGAFGAKAVGIKGGMTAATGLAQWRALRNRPWASTALYTVMNFAGAALTAGIAGRNYAIRGPSCSH